MAVSVYEKAGVFDEAAGGSGSGSGSGSATAAAAAARRGVMTERLKKLARLEVYFMLTGSRTQAKDRFARCMAAVADPDGGALELTDAENAAFVGALLGDFTKGKIKVGRCRLTPNCSRLDRAWFHRMKLEYDEPLSSFAFNLNLRRYIEVATVVWWALNEHECITNSDASLSRGDSPTLEHCLPQTPAAGSEWTRVFPDEVERTMWTNRLANMMLLNRKNNYFMVRRCRLERVETRVESALF